jgi:nucleoid-associated protein EbfC
LYLISEELGMDLSKMQDMLSQASAMREQMDQRLAETVVEADAGGGAVTARMNGKKELLKLTIAPSAASAAAGDITMLEDLIVAAVNAAGRKADDAMQTSAAGLLGGLGFPDL